MPKIPRLVEIRFLSSFLDADGDGDVDISDAIGMASRYLGR